jgi:hypothetical protein
MESQNEKNDILFISEKEKESIWNMNFSVKNIEYNNFQKMNSLNFNSVGRILIPKSIKNMINFQNETLLYSISIEDKNKIISTRLITSGLSVLACLICIIIYFCIFIKNTFEKKDTRKKSEMIKGNESNEDLDDIEEKDIEKRERFLTSENENMEEEKIDNRNSNINLNNETISFENVNENNKTVVLSKIIFIIRMETNILINLINYFKIKFDLNHKEIIDIFIFVNINTLNFT